MNIAMSACPRCQNALVGRRISDVVVHECPECSGVFLDQNAIALVVQDSTNVRAEAVIADLPRAAHSPIPPAGAKLYVKCPTCTTVMNRKLFAAKSGVVVDVCRNHGTFFDAGELPAIIDFVLAGGLEKAAASRTMERVPLKSQPDSFAKQLAAARADRRIDGLVAADAGGALVSLLFDLLS
jgi:Zn-finger nucleic acid-binding protein